MRDEGPIEWHGPCPSCRKMTLLPTCAEKPRDVRCCWCRHAFTDAQFIYAQKAGGWWTAPRAAVWDRVLADVEQQLDGEFMDKPMTRENARRMANRARELLADKGWSQPVEFDTEHLRQTGKIRFGKVVGPAGLL